MTGEKKAAAVKYHRRALMQTADRLLTEYGYDGMNMNMLAKEANYSKATVYVYFSSKDELVRALAVERLEILKKELALVAKSDLERQEKTGELKSVLTEFATEDRVYFDFLTQHFDPESENDTDLDRANKRAVREYIRDIFKGLESFASVAELKDMWFRFYGAIKTGGLIDGVLGE